MKINRTLMVSLVLLLAGIYFSTQNVVLGAAEWTILAGFIALGLLSGALQAYVIALKRRGRISAGRRNLYIALSIVVLILIKSFATANIPSNLTDTGTSLYVQICFSIFAMFLARGWLGAALDKARSRSIN